MGSVSAGGAKEGKGTRGAMDVQNMRHSTLSSATDVSTKNLCTWCVTCGNV